MLQPDFDLYLITDRKLIQGHDLLWVLERALDGGVRAIQLREKDLEGKELFNLADKISTLCRRYDAQLFINDRIDVALAVDASGVQLGKNSLPIATARSLLGAEKLIGFSSHSVKDAIDAQRSGANFLLFGPVFDTPSKASFGAPQGVEALKDLVVKVALPVYAIGGINTASLTEAMTTGVRGVALISAIISAENPTAAARMILANLAR
ncbi:MAG TPA: thiamine phosphate synthase [Candidatus Limnocylindrales bacterium]|nr:thiamine phosphate synthase [Candidatus Limnocylindrales bacterium]